MGLESLSENLPEISANLKFRKGKKAGDEGKIEFIPPIEALKHSYY